MMAKSREYNFSRVILTLFVCLVPILGSTMDEKAVIYTSLCVLLAAWGFNVYKTGVVAITKTTVFFALAAGYSYLQLIWVSDKGSHFAFATLMATCAVAGMLIKQVKDSLGDEIHHYGCTLAYLTALCYAVAAVFSQIFVESKFWGCNMDMGNFSPTAAAFVMLTGIFALFRLFHLKRKTPMFFVAMALMVYVFVMTKSLPAFLSGAILVFLYAMHIRRKRVEAFFALVLSGVLAVANVIYIVYMLVVGNVSFDGTLRALPSVVGLGKGGYNAIAAVVDGGYTSTPLTFDVFGEVYGVFGILLAVFVVVTTFIKLGRNPSLRNVFAFMAIFMMMFTSSSALSFVLPMFAIYYGAQDEGEYVNIHSLIGVAMVLPISFFVVLTGARCLYVFGEDAIDRGNYARAAELYETAAKMEVFNSEGWEKAYDALYKDYNENNADNLIAQETCLKNAAKNNKANYKYQRLIANVYTNGKKYTEALSIWDGIILKYDKEYLYPMYAAKICDVMEHGKISLNEMTNLYKKIEAYGKKCVNMDIKIKVNNVLTESQRYYILAREGNDTKADMYAYNAHGETETPTDTGEEL